MAAGTGRRKLGSLEVSSVDLGVQNIHRTYQTTIPSRPEMIYIIRTAFDRDVIFFDTAEAYGPLEDERILGEDIPTTPSCLRSSLAESSILRGSSPARSRSTA